MFGAAELRDARRTQRLIKMAGAVARRGAGRVTDVFSCAADRQAAYDFLEHDTVEVARVQRALGESCLRQCSDFKFVYVVLDGTSLTLTDRALTKKFGTIGANQFAARGLKVLNTLALEPNGVPIGVPAQVWWARQTPAPNGYRPKDQRESFQWTRAVAATGELRDAIAPKTRLHFIGDREADASELIWQLVQAEHEFTIRSSTQRKVWVKGELRELRGELVRRSPRAVAYVDVQPSARRTARRAKLRIRAEEMIVNLRDHHTKTARRAVLNVVWAREEGTCPANEAPLDWILFTNAPVSTAARARRAVEVYAYRWRIEDFHRTWKKGHCRVEDTQLRTASAVIKWATIHAAVAARAERLRRRARQEPDLPADIELSAEEIEALKLLKRAEKRRTETISDGVPTLGDAVRLIADLGGYTGGSSSGLAGATTIARGLERVAAAAEIIRTLRGLGKLR